MSYRESHHANNTIYWFLHTNTSLSIGAPRLHPNTTQHVNHNNNRLQVRRHRQPRPPHGTSLSPTEQSSSSKHARVSKLTPSLPSRAYHTLSPPNPSHLSSPSPAPNPPPTLSRKPPASRPYTFARSPPSPACLYSPLLPSVLRGSDTRTCSGPVLWPPRAAV